MADSVEMVPAAAVLARVRPERERGGLRSAVSGLLNLLAAAAALTALTGGVCFAVYGVLCLCPEPPRETSVSVPSVVDSETVEGVFGY